MRTSFLLTMLTTSLLSTAALADMCGPTDDRVLSNDPKVGRLSRDGQNYGCTVTMISAKCGITSGTCMPNSAFAEFNPPLSIGGVAMPSKAEDQYRLDLSFYEFEETKKIGENWGVVKFEKNPVTNRFPGDVQGYYNIISEKMDKDSSIRVVSYGADDSSETKTFAQQTAKGLATKPGVFLLPTIIEFTADTGWASSGSPIINVKTNEVAGINTHGGCEVRKSNTGTFLYKNKKVLNAIAACLKE